MVVLLGLAAAVLLATGFVLQQHEAAALPTGRLGPALLLRLVRRPVWLGGIGAMVGGQLLGAAALGMGSLVVVEPLLATNVLFALPMAAVASRRRLSRADWAGALMLVAGLALFLLGGAARSAVDTRTVAAPSWLLAGAVLVAVVVLLLVLGRGRDRRISAALTAGAAGIVFGAQDFLTQRTLVRSGPGVLALLASWPPWVLIAVAVTGLTLAQRAFGLADLSASLPPITLAEPLCGIALSAAILGAALPHRALELAAAAAGLSMMIAGVVILTRSPLVVGPRRTPRSRSSAAHRHQRGHGAD